ncbi:MAG: hypothetical protein HKN11_11525 [Rhizobiales bacterium]|nr:hypothetical protein [Hyphomicrobiales bacterium]
MKSVVAYDDQDGQEALKSMADALIDVRQSAMDRNLKFLTYLVEMAIVEVSELQGHSSQGVTTSDEPPPAEPPPAEPITSLYAPSPVFAKNINK